MSSRDYHKNELDEICQLVHSLPQNSPLRTIFDNITRPAVEKLLAETAEEDFNSTKWPMFYGLLAIYGADGIDALLSDIVAVANASNSSIDNVACFLKHRIGEKPGTFYGELFELYLKSASVRTFSDVAFDVPVFDDKPDGKNCDLRCKIGKKTVRFELTVLNEDDESRQVWNNYINDKDNGRPSSLVRPGPYCPTDENGLRNAKGPSPYYEARRIYLKLFDKIAKGLNPDQTQLSMTDPNVICLNFGPGVNPNRPPVRWVLDELFSTQPRSSGDPDKGGSAAQVALSNWIDRYASDCISTGSISCDDYIEYFNRQTYYRLIRRISGVVLFDSGRYHSARLNYNCLRPNRISHATMARIIRAFRKQPAKYM